MKNPLDPRHKKRQKLVEELFKIDFTKQRLSEKAKEIFSQKETIDSYIAKVAPEFPIDKINKIDVAILRLAIYELMVEKKRATSCGCGRSSGIGKRVWRRRKQ